MSIQISFSKDSKHYVYWAVDKFDKWHVVLDNNLIGEASDGVKGGIIFVGKPSDPMGVQVAYGAVNKFERAIYVNGKQVGPVYDKIASGLSPLSDDRGFEVLVSRDKSLYRLYWVVICGLLFVTKRICNY